LYQRLTLAESTRYLASKNLPDEEHNGSDIDEKNDGDEKVVVTPTTATAEASEKEAHFKGLSFVRVDCIVVNITMAV
jgi:hypothetical protein